MKIHPILGTSLLALSVFVCSNAAQAAQSNSLAKSVDVKYKIGLSDTAVCENVVRAAGLVPKGDPIPEEYKFKDLVFTVKYKGKDAESSPMTTTLNVPCTALKGSNSEVTWAQKNVTSLVHYEITLPVTNIRDPLSVASGDTGRCAKGYQLLKDLNLTIINSKDGVKWTDKNGKVIDHRRTDPDPFCKPN